MQSNANENELNKRKCAIIPIDDPSPIAYMNVYEEGDIWIKIRGCEDCPLESRKICCGTCPFLLDGRCSWHEKINSSKPFYCVVLPAPNTCQKFCYLEFKCIKGSMKGKIRRVRDRGDVFR